MTGQGEEPPKYQDDADELVAIRPLPQLDPGSNDADDRGGQTAESRCACLKVAETPTIQVLQYMMLGAGAVGSAYVLYRIATRPGQRQPLRALWPHLVLLVVLVLINVYMFAQPMAHRA